MKLIEIIAVAVWVIVLALIIIHAAWAHHALSSSTATHQPPKSTVHRLMLISEGRDMLLAVAALVAAVFVVRSARRAPSVILTVAAGLAVLLWAASFIMALRHTDRTFFALRPWNSTHLVLFWHAFLDPGLRCLLAGTGLACGIIGITMHKKTGAQNKRLQTSSQSSQFEA